jgi:CheY-like chemotaxis protein
VQKYYRMMLQNARRLLELVNQLLDLSQLESGKMKLQLTKGDLAAFVRGIAHSFESLANQKNIEFVISAPSFPPGYFDRDKIEKIITNILSNAFKFTPENGRIELNVTDEKNLVKIRVIDNGIGITADYQKHLFERFSTSTYSQIQQGSGIGLALTKELVTVHKGSISVISKEGEGSIFEVSIYTSPGFYEPSDFTNDQPEDVTINEPGLASNPGAVGLSAGEQTIMEELLPVSGKPLLLIVEDNPEVRSYIIEQLGADYQIIEASHGGEGMEKAFEKIPDIIITDVMMPEVDGAEFSRKLKNDDRTSHIPVIMLTARAEQANKLEGLKTGVDEYLVKPFDTQELRIRAANLIEQRIRLQKHYRRSFDSLAPEMVLSESVDVRFLRSIRQTIDNHLENEYFNVTALSSEIGMSRSQLHRKLTALTGYSPNEIIRNMRLQRAHDLLQVKAGNASEIAYKTGFTSPSYFAKCFKDYFGISPSEV